MRLLLLACLALVGLALAPSAAAYTCTQYAPDVRVCDVNDDGTPDVYFVGVNGPTGYVTYLTIVAYKDPAITSVGVAYNIYQAGFHSGGVNVGCYDPGQDLDCDYGSVAVGSTDAGYFWVDKFGGNIQACMSAALGYSCIPL
jgi:hypothetical protein